MSQPSVTIDADLGTLIFEKAKIGMCFVGKDGRFLRANEYLCSILGYSQAELCSKTFQDITHHDDLHGDAEMVEAVLLGKLDEYYMLKRYRTKQDTYVWAKLTMCGVKESNNEVAFFFSQISESSLMFESHESNARAEYEASERRRKRRQGEDTFRIVKKWWPLVLAITGAASYGILKGISHLVELGFNLGGTP